MIFLKTQNRWQCRNKHSQRQFSLKTGTIYEDSPLGLDEFRHKVVDHAVEYVRGTVHTNGCEFFWSLLKRGLHGTYVSVEPFFLFRYLDEQAYRFNHRHMTDAERFDLAVRGITGKRLMYDQLTGKTMSSGA